MTASHREYEQSHPWLTFDTDRQFERAPALLWQLLGKVVALADQLAQTPMLPSYADRMHRIALVKGAVATTAIEGNTLTEEEVSKLLDKQLTLPPSKEYLGVEVQNMMDAFNAIMETVRHGAPLRVTPETIMEHNRQVLRGLALDPDVIAGEISAHSVVVGPYRGAPRRDCAFLLEQLSGWIKHGVPDTTDRTPMATAVLSALLAHLYLAWIHAFGDGNGRTARLVEFQILACGGIPGPAAHLLSNHFNDTRTEYYRQLNHASRSGGDVVPFLIYALQGFYDGLQSQLAELREQTRELMWGQLVSLAIPGHGLPDSRRRQLALAMFDRRHLPPLRRADMAMLTAELARAHADRTGKTLTRDLTVLLGLGLLHQESKGLFRAADEKISGLTRLRP